MNSYFLNYTPPCSINDNSQTIKNDTHEKMLFFIMQYITFVKIWCNLVHFFVVFVLFFVITYCVNQMLLNHLSEAAISKHKSKQTETYKYLHEIAEKIHKRSMIFLFTDMFQSDAEQEKMFSALQHLKYNKHDLVLFHTYDKEKEETFDFSNRPKRFVDVETGEHVNLYADNIK